MSLFNFFLILHIVGGTLGLLAGSITILAKKGDKRHRLTGRIFAVCMLGAGISSLILAALHSNDFLFVVGIFTIYMTGTGWRYLAFKNLHVLQKALFIDWALIGFMLIGCILFLWFGVSYIYQKKYFGLITLLFFWRGITFVRQDIRFFSGQRKTKNDWLIAHLQRMSGAYIASLTAFAVVNAPPFFSIIPWLLPSIIVVPFLVKWTKKYTKPSTSIPHFRSFQEQ